MVVSETPQKEDKFNLCVFAPSPLMLFFLSRSSCPIQYELPCHPIFSVHQLWGEASFS